MTKNLPTVTDHALVRWLERVHGVDVELFRRQIAEKCAGLTTARAVRVGGFSYVMRDGVVITVRPEKHMNPRGVPRDDRRHEAAP